jgi:hypothetical protein
MIRKRFILLSLLQSLLLMAPFESKATGDQPHLFDTILRLSGAPQPLGGPIWLNLDYVNSQRVKAYLELDWRGLPKGLEIRVSDEQERSIKTKLLGGAAGSATGPPTPVFDKLYVLQPGERVRMRFDLALLFALDQPGLYRVELLDGQVHLAEGRVRIVRLEGVQETQIDGICEHFTAETRGPDVFGGPVQCRLEVGNVPEQEGSAGYAVLQGLTIARERSRRSSIRVSVPKDTRVQAQALDTRWQLWTVFVAGGKSSLVIWDLERHHARFAIPWGEHVIELGSTPVRPGSHAKIVIAGVAGQAKLSTLDDSPADDR